MTVTQHLFNTAVIICPQTLNIGNVYLTVIGSALFFIGVIFCVTAVISWDKIQSPSVGLFAVIATTAGIGAMALSIGVLTEQPVVVLLTAIIIGLFLPIPWIVFCFDYVGRESLVSHRVTGIISIPSVVGLFSTLIIFGERLLPWFSLAFQSDTILLTTILTSIFDLIQFFGLLYAGGVMLVGTGLILQTFQRYLHLDSTTGVMLGTFGTIPWIAILFGLQLQPASFLAFITTVTIGFGLGSLSGVALVGPYPLFNRVPTAGNVGPKTVVDELEEMIIVTDGDGTVVELNAAAESSVNSVETSIGQSVNSLFDASLEELNQKQVITLHSKSGRTLFEPAVSEVTDQHGQPLGYAIVLRDETIRMTRQRRLDVLNRILRHNVRNSMNVIVGHANMIQNRSEDESIRSSADLIGERGDELVDISQSARDTEEVLNFEAESQQLTPLDPVIQTVLESVRAEYDGKFRYHNPDDVVVPMTEGAIEAVLEELAENAVKHNDADDPSVTIRARYEPGELYPITVSVIDNGPGIPELEQQVIEFGDETSLDHASGVGLWSIRWISTSAGGKLSIADREPHGSIVSLSLPSADEREPNA